MAIDSRERLLLRAGFLGRDALALDENAFAQLLHRRLMVPLLERDQLMNISPGVIARVPADMATEFRVVPIAVDADGNLSVAMANPADSHAVSEIAFFTGHYVLRAVARDSDISWAIARHYGIGATAPIAREAPPTEEAPILLTQFKRKAGSRAPKTILDRVVDAALRLRVATTHEEIASCALEFLSHTHRQAFFLIARRGVFCIDDVLGFDVIPDLTIPASEPSLLRDIAVAGVPYRGAVPPGPWNDTLRAALGGAAEIILVPIRVGTRIIAMVVMHEPIDSLPDGALEMIALESGAAYARLLENTRK